MNNMKRTMSFLLIAIMIINVVTVSQNLNTVEVSAQQEGYFENETTTEQSGEVIEESSETPSDETTTEPILESTTEPIIESTTEPIIESTTEEPTTTQPESVKPWGKNSLGQFVNGKGKVIKGATMKGIDVSHHNGKIDWKKVAESDVDFALIRCGFGDNYKKQDDEYWEYNVTQCEKYKIPYGVYIYSYATSVNQAKSEVDHVLRLIGKRKFSFPIYLDMEDEIQRKLSMTMRKNIANTFLNEIKKQGYECGVYANLDWWENYIPSDVIKNSNWYKWVAQYNDEKCDYTGSYEIWQCTSKGRVDGVYGDVDINFWFGEIRDVNYCSWTKPVVPKVTPPAKTKWKTVKVGKKKVTLKWKKVSKAKGYRIQFSTSKKFKKNVKNKYTTKTSITIKRLKSKKKYYFRIKAYKVNTLGKKIYSKKWSNIRKKRVK